MKGKCGADDVGPLFTPGLCVRPFFQVSGSNQAQVFSMEVDARGIAGDEVEPPMASSPGVQDTRHAIWRTQIIASRHHDQFGTRFANSLVVVIGNTQIVKILAHPNMVRPFVLRRNTVEFGQGAVAGKVVAEDDFNGLTSLVQAAHGGSFYRVLLVIGQQQQRHRKRLVGVLGHMHFQKISNNTKAESHANLLKFERSLDKSIYMEFIL